MQKETRWISISGRTAAKSAAEKMLRLHMGRSTKLLLRQNDHLLT